MMYVLAFSPSLLPKYEQRSGPASVRDVTAFGNQIAQMPPIESLSRSGIDSGCGIRRNCCIGRRFSSIYTHWSRVPMPEQDLAAMRLN